MNIIDIVILGILQGITEFLPVSSSGHLVLAQYMLGIESPGNTLEILFHIGTLFSVFYVFNKDIKSIVMSLNEKPTQKLVIYIIIATIPAVIIGLIFKSHIINLFSSIVPVGYALLSTGVILTLSINFKNKNKSTVIDIGDDDAIVRVSETKLNGADDFLIIPVRHSRMMKNTDVQVETLNFLQKGQFTKKTYGTNISEK